MTSSKTKEFNLASLEASDTATVTIIGLDGEPLQGDGGVVEVEVYGPGSQEYQRAQTKIEQAAQTRAFAALRGKAKTQDDGRADQVEKLVACTHEIRHLPMAPRDLYDNPRLGYITNQVAKFIEDWGNFLPKPAKN